MPAKKAVTTLTVVGGGSGCPGGPSSAEFDGPDRCRSVNGIGVAVLLDQHRHAAAAQIGAVVAVVAAVPGATVAQAASISVLELQRDRLAKIRWTHLGQRGVGTDPVQFL